MNLQLLTINGTDLTEYVEPSEYAIMSERKYNSWIDCNYHEHRNYTLDRITGDVVLIFVDGMKGVSFADFVAMFDGDRITAGVYVMNTGAFKTISAYWNIETSELHDGNRVVNRVKLTIAEV